MNTVSATASTRILTETKLKSESAFQGGFLHVLRDTVHMPDGAVASREYIRHPGAVLIAPMLADGQLVLERQFRYPLAKVFIEFPAGKIDANERPAHCAARELKEETGYAATELAYLGPIHNAIAYSDEVIHLYAARGLKAGVQQLDEHEHIELMTMNLDELLVQIRAGAVTDVKTIIAAYWLKDAEQGIKALQWQSVGELRA